MTLGTVVVTLVAGTVIGLLGKLVAPGDRDNIPLWLTILCGIAGALIGTTLYGVVYGSTETPGVDWWRHLWQVTVAAVLVVLAASITGRRSS